MSAQKSYQETHGPMPSGPVIDDEGLAQQTTGDDDEGLAQQTTFVDAHVHVTSPRISYRPEVQGVIDSSAAKLGKGKQDLDEADYCSAMKDQTKGMSLGGAIFVEVLPATDSSIDEASWVLDMIADPASSFQALVASIPGVLEGASQVREWLDALRARCATETLPSQLRGARMQFPEGEAGDAVLRSDAFAAGLEELGKQGLHFEFCVHADRLPAVVDAVSKCPGTRCVLNHCGLNDSGQAFDAWKQAIGALAACENCVVKLSAIEEWQPRECTAAFNPAPLSELALCAKLGSSFKLLPQVDPYSSDASITCRHASS